MTRDELIEALLLERYGPRPRRCERRQEPAPAQPVPHFTDTPAAQERRRAILAGAIDSRDEFTERNIA